MTIPSSGVRVHYESFAVPTRPAVGRVHERTELVRLLRLAKRRVERALEPDGYLVVADDGSSYATWRTIRSAADEVLDELPPLSDGLRAYRRDLGRIVTLAKRHQVETIFVTQPALWGPEMFAQHRRLLWMGEVGNAPGEGRRTYYSAASLAEGMARYNAVLLEVCEENSLPCVDLAKDVPRDTTIFYDDVHFNESGARYVAEKIATSILSSLRLEGS